MLSRENRAERRQELILLGFRGGDSERDMWAFTGTNKERGRIQQAGPACGKAGRELVPGYRRNVQEVGWSECLKGT